MYTMRASATALLPVVLASKELGKNQEQSDEINETAADTEPSVIYEPTTGKAVKLYEWDVSSLAVDADKELKDAIRRAHGLGKQDNVQVYIVPKGKMKSFLGSFITRPNTSTKAQQLTMNINNSTSRLRELEMGFSGHELSKEEKARLMNSLRHNIRDKQRSLENEKKRISALPRSGWIVVERDD